MAEAHDLPVAVKDLLDVRVGVTRPGHLVQHREHAGRRAAVERPAQRPDGRRHRGAAVSPCRSGDPGGESRGIEPVLGGADPVGVDSFHVVRVGLSPPAEEELLRRGLTRGDHVVGSGLTTFGDRRRFRHDRHHLRRKAGKVITRLGVVDVDDLAELPFAREVRGLGLEVRGSVAAQSLGLVRLRIRHAGLEVLVDEKAPDLLVGHVADELLDVDSPVAKGAALSVGLGDLGLDGDDAFEALGLNSFICFLSSLRARYLSVVPGRPAYNQAPMPHRVTLIPGDGTGPEIAEATRRVIDASGVTIDWDVQYAGADVMDENGGNPLPDHVLDSIRTNGVAIKGPITTPVGVGFRSVNVALRKALDLYGQVRPCKRIRASAHATTPSTSSSYARTPRISTRASSSSRVPRRLAS